MVVPIHRLTLLVSPEPVFGPRPAAWWDSAGVGVGPPPIETSQGWLVTYHGVRDTVAGALYRVGLLLLDMDNPALVRARTPEWAFGPTEPYEQIGNVAGVVFPCGLTHHPDTDELRLYYGAANTCIAMATTRLADVVARLLADHTQPGTPPIGHVAESGTKKVNSRSTAKEGSSQ